MALVLLVSRDPGVIADVRRAGAVLAADVAVRADPAGVLAEWRRAAAVVVDVAAADLLPPSLPRREHAVVVAAAADAAAWRCAAMVGADAVLALPADEPALVDLLLAATDDAGPPGRVVGVRPAAGGAGATTVAVALALAAARAGAAVTLVDADAGAGGVDLLLGVEHHPGLRWPDLAEVRGAVPAASVRDALVRAGAIRLLPCSRRPGGGPAPAAAAAVLPALRRGQDLVVVDLPRTLDDAAAVLAGGCDAVVLVAPADVRGTAAAATLVEASLPGGTTPLLVVRRGAGRRLHPRDVAAALQLSLAAVVDTDPDVVAAADRGRLDRAVDRGPFAAAGAAVWAALAAPEAAA